jgi:hypothetical protein
VTCVLSVLETPADLRLVGLCLKDLAVKGYVMKRSESLRGLLLVLSSLVMLACTLLPVAQAQGLRQVPTPIGPSNDCGCPRGEQPIPVSSGMLAPFLPKIPNLEFGFLYSFGGNVRTGRFTADYTLPYHLSPDSVLFGEAHAEGWDFWKRPNVSITTPAGFTTTTTTANNRVDLSFGGGYRTMLGDNTFLGVNGFYDTSRLYNRWYSSGGVGLEMAYTVGADDAVDLNFNWYGNLFNKDVLVNAFRTHGGSFDVEAGYSHALFDHALDLRLKVAGYQFDVGNTVYGWRGGADLTTRNGMFTLRYEHGRDRIDGEYNTVGAFANVGFHLENLLKGESPFTVPEPVFRSPRNLRRMLSQKVKRNWYAPATVVLSRMAKPGLDKPGMTLLFRGTNPTPRVWPMGGSGTGYSRPFLEAIVPMAVANSATLITVTFTITANTVDSPGRAGVRAPTIVWFTAPGTPMVPAGGAAVGTHLFLLAPGQFTRDVSNVGIEWYGDPSVNGTMNIQDFVVEFWK